MAIKFQYNKTSLQQLEKQLKVRVRTLPIIKNKESALRMEVKRCKTEAADLEDRLEQQIQAYEAMFALWNEFDASLIKVNDVHLGVKKIAGVRVPLEFEWLASMMMAGFLRSFLAYKADRCIRSS